MGVVGVAYAALIPLLFSVPVILVLVCRLLEINIFYYLKHVVLSLLLPVITMIVFFLFYKQLFLIESYIGLFSSGAIAFSLYLAVFYIFVLSRKEKGIVNSIILKKLPVSKS